MVSYFYHYCVHLHLINWNVAIQVINNKLFFNPEQNQWLQAFKTTWWTFVNYSNTSVVSNGICLCLVLETKQKNAEFCVLICASLLITSRDQLVVVMRIIIVTMMTIIMIMMII